MLAVLVYIVGADHAELLGDSVLGLQVRRWGSDRHRGMQSIR